MVVFAVYDPIKHERDFIQLNIEYIGWIADQVLKRYGIDFLKSTGMSVEKYVRTNYENFISVPVEEGRLLILEDSGKVIGMGALTKHDMDEGEIKRMYVKPEYRGKGFGKKLLMKLIDIAKDLEYTALRLNTGGFMDTAQYVYTSVGFRKIPEYTESEVPIPLNHQWFFMELES
ncbi:MAG: GNAT family N-acetyltransferase [Candidatus Thorarchaeota archaeon]